jgi:hypothetical protein
MSPSTGYSKQLSSLGNAILDQLSSLKAYDLPEACAKLGLDPGTGEDAFKSKGRYVEVRLLSHTEAQLQQLAKTLLSRSPTFALQEALALSVQGQPAITEVTRRSIIDQLSFVDLGGKISIVDLLARVWPLSTMPSTDIRFRSAEGDIGQHMVNNNDWDAEYLFVRYLRLLEASDSLFCRFLEELVHPVVREINDQDRLVAQLNELLRSDGFTLLPYGQISGRPIFKASPIKLGVSGRPKNLIFASTGPKPKIVLRDAVNNDIEIVKHGDLCLVYDEEIDDRGLTWGQLTEWWSSHCGNMDSTARGLYRRLKLSLGSEPEKVVFRHYYRRFLPILHERLPALIPQVYLHYDPLTVRERGADGPLARQRMDFLLLLSRRDRVVIEVDGRQHYSGTTGIASPVKYAQMAAADRDLKLAGYDVYRFGGHELMADRAATTLDGFWTQFFRRHGMNA